MNLTIPFAPPVHLTPQQGQIIDYLNDGEWHCMANPGFYMKDDRTRISELIRKGYEIQSQPCDGRCRVDHSARIFMRKLVEAPHFFTNLTSH